ncbi:hypothetical protein SSP24_08280 [Streptomyces spinoverrucosus]|uniref:YncI copper-binding domain-containing protein n=1 Tax=Streptomyces spinoverrucosus TaxID=284043 RepID=A0A4Y3V9Y7_9ACTN|nr:DUF1775 domain-containing protein [Streptomyces spinoverrucosus]GEC03173.1 hypothetical protein SSP24_08280 [Streptomyces spinoverrucosus]GHB37678.1 hypothetical protein GCM10010397_04290 [Streptomyces spinoverrucosus]
MHRPGRARLARRLTTVSATLAAAVLLVAGPAFAHTEVEADNARALAQNVTLTFSAASESSSAGITGLEVFLPDGITPTDVTYEDGPKDWKFATTGRGYKVSGPQLAVGEDAEFSVTVRQLPDAEELVFKTLQSYSDGRVDRWIELEDSGDGHGHGHPAPKLELGPAEPGAKPVSPTPTETATPEAPPSTASADAAAEPTATPSPKEAADEDDGISPVVLTAGGAVVLLGVGAGVWWFRRRTNA